MGGSRTVKFFRQIDARRSSSSCESMAGANEEQDWLALAAGQGWAVGALYDRHARRMLAVARAITGSDADAEDAVQQTFLDLHRSRAALARADDPRAYAYRALRNAALRSRRQVREAPLPDDFDPAHAAGPAPDRDAELERALSRLPLDQREVVALKIDGELTFAQIAAALGVSPNTAASRYRYALERLRSELGGAR